MPFDLEGAQRFHAPDATEPDIHKAFDDDEARGEFIILTGLDGSFIQAAGEEEGPYALEISDAKTGEHLRVQGELTKKQAREAFLQFYRGDPALRTAWRWEKVPDPGFLGGPVAIALIVAALVLAPATLWVVWTGGFALSFPLVGVVILWAILFVCAVRRG
jgi:hypothetical protein